MPLFATLLFGLACTQKVSAEEDGDGYRIGAYVNITGNAGDGTFAPYYIASNRHGFITQSKGALIDAGIVRPWEEISGFSYGFGAEIVGDYYNSTDYRRFRSNDGDQAQWTTNSQRPQPIWLQQLYGEVRFHGVFLTVGMKKHGSALLNQRLSSGDLVESGNARPIPEARIGFNDFQDIPFTNGWVQIQGEISYGKLTDNKWLREHFNYYTGHINQGALYSYKRCYFRTKPSQPFSVTVGMQVGAMFGGTTTWYQQGKITKSMRFSRGIKEFFKIFLPTDGGQTFYSGSSLGSWDFVARYRLRNGAELKAYFQKPWEDGSGIGFMNGFDGVWGLEYKAASPGIVNGVVVEYLDFTNQSGPLHWDPDDVGGSTIETHADGADDYYNNHEYNSYAYYGMSIGTPFLPSPIYNTDGYLQFVNNRVRGFHIGIEGEPCDFLKYRLLGGYRKGWGNGYVPAVEPTHDTSFMAEATYTPRKIAGLGVNLQIAADRGTMLGDRFGVCIGISYRGDFVFGKK